MSVCKVEWFPEKLPEMLLQEGGRRQRKERRGENEKLQFRE